MTLSTGIQAIDQTFGGGIPEGSLVVLTSPPEAQVDPLLNAGVHVRPTLYFTTLRTEAAVHKELARLIDEPQLKLLQYVGVDGALADILAGMERLNRNEDVIVDVLDPLEEAADQQTYVSFLNNFSERLQATDSIGILHCLDTDDPPANRKLTLSAADFVWELTLKRGSKEMGYELRIPKASGLTLDDDDRVLDLILGQTVRIDNSRDIA